MRFTDFHTRILSFNILAFASCIFVFVAVLGRTVLQLLARQVFAEDIIPGSKVLSFSPNFREDGLVALRIIESSHYALNSGQADEEWAALMPTGGHTIQVTSPSHPNIESPETRTVSLFHQLKCLDIIRQQYNAPPSQPISGLTRHCMNYIRQTILCWPNLRLESARQRASSVRNYDTVCRDWNVVYEEAERNYREYKALQK
jgi:hypothetical protein